MIFIWHNLFFIRHDKNEEEEGHEKGEVDMIQILDIVQKLSIDPTFLSLLHDLMHKTADRFHGLPEIVENRHFETILCTINIYII